MEIKSNLYFGNIRSSSKQKANSFYSKDSKQRVIRQIGIGMEKEVNNITKALGLILNSIMRSLILNLRSPKEIIY